MSLKLQEYKIARKKKLNRIDSGKSWVKDNILKGQKGDQL